MKLVSMTREFAIQVCISNLTHSIWKNLENVVKLLLSLLQNTEVSLSGNQVSHRNSAEDASISPYFKSSLEF